MKSKAWARGEYDIIIKGGTLYNGVSPEPRLADVAVKGGKIVAVGDLQGTAAEIIDAKNLIVTPGFIDVHTHCDITFRRTGWKRYLSYFMPSWKGNYNYLYQGVTTVVSGNCGYGYSDTEKWFGMLKTLSFGSNVYHLAPHGMIREELFGKNQPRELTRRQMDLFKGRVAEEMEKGAIGLSTGLEYAPGIYATSNELIELLKVVRRYGGLHTTHRRDETARIHNDGMPGTLKSTQEAIEIGRRAEVPVEISHLKIAPPYNNVTPEHLLELIGGARDEGLDITADQYPYDAGSTYITVFLPNEFKAKLGVKDEFKTKSGRQEIKKAIKEVFSYLGPDKILISFFPAEDSYEGKTLKQISEETGKHPADCYANMVCDEQPPVGIFFYLRMDDVRALMKSDFILTASDGWTVPKDMTKPHPRCYGTFPKKIRDFAIREEMLDLPRAIMSMTSLPAEKFKFKGRGKVMEGYYADIAVIDLKKMASHATYLEPHQYATGVRYLLVNGVLSIAEGKATGDRGGKTLRRT
jgi:N-acyl-D-aspartate/D-glutamate deacylase